MKLNYLTDSALLSDTKRLVKAETHLTLKILFHFAEIEKRKLYSDLKCKSLFDYAVRELAYSPSAAQRRVEASRLLRDFPEVAPKIQDGRLSLSNIAAANSFFKLEKIKNRQERHEILDKLENKSSREGESILLSLSQRDLKKDSCKQVKEDTFRWEMNVSKETQELWVRLKGLKAHQNLTADELMKLALKNLIKAEEEKLEPVRTVLVKSKNSRYIPVTVKAQVMKRDKFQCVQCASKYKLQIDHIKPFAKGGLNSVNNLRVLCRSCNERARIKAGLVNYEFSITGAGSKRRDFGS